VIVANRLLMMRAGLGVELLEAAATGTTIGMAVAMLLSGWAVRSQFGVFIPLATWLRAAVAAGAGYWTASAIPHDSAPEAVLALAAGFAATLAALAMSRELSADDWRALRRVVRRD
jgi:L-asparaginase II